MSATPWHRPPPLFAAATTRQSPGFVASPCVSICRMNPATGLCEGCLRTLDEIAGWSSFDDQAKRAVLARLETRRAPAPGTTG